MLDHIHGVLTVEDNLKTNALYFMEYILSKVKCGHIQVLCVEKTPAKWKNLLGENIKTVHCGDTRGWKTKLLSILNSIDKDTTLIIDSIVQLSLFIGWDSCLQFLKQFRNKEVIKNVIVIFHNDCLLYGIKMIKHLQYISQVYITLTTQEADIYQLGITTSSIGGKLKKTTQHITRNTENNKWVNTELKQVVHNVNKDKEQLPEDLASFKISVDNAAKAVKDKMVLPYTEILKTESKIIYHHDAGDDWDDEDPDDDLDI